MKLSEYMELTGKNDAAIAAGVKRDRSTVTKWRLGITRPDWEALASLAKFTNNAVTASDFVREAAQ